MASSTWDSLTCSNLFVVNATVTGFAQTKQGNKTDYAFVVQVEWSDDRTRFVKRTYADFLNLQYKILKTYTNEIKAQATQGTPFNCISGRKPIFQRNDSKLAESREPHINRFVRDVIRLPQTISQSSTILSFFESRTSDPQPFRPEKSSEEDDENGNDYQVDDDDENTDFFIDMTDLMLTEDMDYRELALSPQSPTSANAIWGSYLERFPKLLSGSMNDLTGDPFTYQDFGPDVDRIREEQGSDTDDESTDPLGDSNSTVGSSSCDSITSTSSSS